jgi:hypothetical protein
VEEPQQYRSEGEKDERGDNRYLHHPPAYCALRLGIEVLRLLKEGHQGEKWTHANEQEQEQPSREGQIDYREIR